MPIYQTATFRHPGLGQSTGYDYSRTGNPTRAVLEETLAQADGGCRGLAFASGMTLPLTNWSAKRICRGIMRASISTGLDR